MPKNQKQTKAYMMHIHTPRTDTKYQQLNITPSLSLELAFVKGGTFMMGGESGSNHSKPIHPVALDDFWIGKYPLTQAQWRAVLEEANKRGIKHALDVAPSRFKSSQRPVEEVSWEDSQAWIAILNELIAPQAKGEPSFDFPLGQGKFSLPSEAQWEYAARGGIYAAQEDYLYAGSNEIEQVAWYRDNAFKQTMPVGLKAPNQLGIYDMTGNVWEWCLDAYEADFYQKCLEQAEAHAQKVSKNPLCSDYSKTSRSVYRGGSSFDYAEPCRTLYRYDFDAGFRYLHLGLRLGFFFFSS